MDASKSSRTSSYEQKIELKFEDRSTKDSFLFLIKAFNAKKAMKDSEIVKRIQNVDLNNNDNFNYILEIDSLREDLSKLGSLNDKYLRDKKMYYEEARRYEKEVEEIIRTYTKIAEEKYRNVNELDQSVLELREKKDEVMDRKLQGLIHENFVLREKLDFMKKELNSRGLSNLAESSIGGMVEESRFHEKSAFGKKRQFEEVEAGRRNQFDTILEKLNESEVREESKHDEQLKSLAQEKSYLAKKLNESVSKVAQLEEKIKKLRLNNSAAEHNQSSLSLEGDCRGNITQYEFGQGREESKGAQTNRSQRSDVPFLPSESDRFNLKLDDLDKPDFSVKSKKTLNPEDRQEVSAMLAHLRKKN